MLGQPGPIKYLGGGQRLWTFKDGVLTFLRTFKAGAFKLDIAFARDAGVLSCTANTTLAREDGVGAIRMDSHFGDGDVEITNQKQISSSCRVAKRE